MPLPNCELFAMPSGARSLQLGACACSRHPLGCPCARLTTARTPHPPSPSCDGSEPQRKYYSKLYEHMPNTTMVLTLGCGKFRIFDQDFGTLPGTDLPRLLDMGQCNDAYSALVVATELAKVFNTDVNSLPLSLDLSWFEQKAVAVLLTLLHLGVRNIRLGPRLPAFLTPEAVAVLVQRFNLMPANVADPAGDMKLMMTCK